MLCNKKGLDVVHMAQVWRPARSTHRHAHIMNIQLGLQSMPCLQHINIIMHTYIHTALPYGI